MSVLLLSVRSRLYCAYVESKIVCFSLLLVLQILLFGVTFCTVLLVSFQEEREIMKEPRLCMSNLSHGPIATWRESGDPKNFIWAPPWLNRGLKSSFFRLHSTITRTNTEPGRAVLHTRLPSMIFTYIPTDTVSAQAITVAETCINICHASYSKCSSQYSYASRESRRQRSRAVRVLKLYSRGPEFNPFPNRLQDLSLLVPSLNPHPVTLVNSQPTDLLPEIWDS